MLFSTSACSDKVVYARKPIGADGLIRRREKPKIGYDTRSNWNDRPIEGVGRERNRDVRYAFRLPEYLKIAQDKRLAFLNGPTHLRNKVIASQWRPSGNLT